MDGLQDYWTKSPFMADPEFLERGFICITVYYKGVEGSLHFHRILKNRGAGRGSK